MDASSPVAFTNTWRVLGLSVAAGYGLLGSMGILAPLAAATSLGLRQKPSPETDEVLRNSMFLLGVRDVSIGAALFAFYYQDKPRAMGTAILSGMILCVGDVWLVWKLRNDLFAGLLGIGASIWMWIGYELVNL